MDKVLKIYYSNNGVEAPFPNAVLQAELYSFQYDCKRMGTAPTITASVMYPLCLDNDWTDNTYVYFRGEKYYISNKPSSSYSNTDARYKHELTFVSERKILENIYFTDGILTNFHFFGDLNMLAGRLNDFFTKSSLPYTVFVDSGISTEEKDIEINKLYVNDALAKGFEIFNIPYYFVGTNIRFGYYQNEITTPFEYGVDNALLSVNRENSNNKIVTRITGVGSSDNIPYYYPNFNESGEHDVTTNPTGYANDISKLNYLKIDPYTSLRNGGYAQYYKACVNPIGNDFDEVSIQVLSETNAPIIDEYNHEWKSGFLAPSYPDYILTNTQDIVVTITPRIFNQNIELNSIVHAIAKSSQVGEEDYVSDNVISEITSIVGLRGYQQVGVTYTHTNGVISLNSGVLNKIIIRLKCTFKKQVRVRYYDWYIEYYYDTKYSTSSRNVTVKSTDGDIDEKVYSDFNKVIDFPSGTSSFTKQIFYTITREVAGYSSCYFDCSFKAVFLDNNGDDMSEWNIYSAKPTALVDSEGNNYTNKIWYNETSRYAHFRNTSSSSKVITATMVALVKITTNTTAYGVELEYIPNFGRNEKPYDYWKFHDGEEVKYSVAGIKFDNTSDIPDGLKVIFSATKNWIEPKPYLMPSVYRNTKGLNIWYNAVNNRYKDENGNFISFVNLYNPKSPKEYISDPKEYIKPSIVGITVNGQRIDQITDIEFDTNDNNEEWITDADGNNQTLKHSFFFVKLRRMDFNLFDQALEKGEMTISMTSGHCGSCNFTIMVDEETQKNTVQVDNNGDLIRDAEGNIKFGSPQDIQQDTTKEEVWIALRKEEDSYGVIMPDKDKGLIPISNKDTFVLTNILLPNSYIEHAEKRLERELIKDLKENNEEKFDFSIDFSRIYLAKNLNIYNSINENAKVFVTYNGIVNELYIDSYSYRMDADKPLPQIKVDLKRNISVVKNAIQRSEGKIIQYVKEVVVNNQKETEKNTRKGGSTTQNGDVSVVQEMGFSSTSVMSQNAVTKAINAVEENIAEVTQYMGQSTEKVMSQKAVTNELKKLSNNNTRHSLTITNGANSVVFDGSEDKVVDIQSFNEISIPKFSRIEYNEIDSNNIVQGGTLLGGEIIYVDNLHPLSDGFYWYATDGKYYKWWASANLFKNESTFVTLPNKIFECGEDGQQYVFLPTSYNDDGTERYGQLLKLTDTKMLNVTYSELKNLTDNAKLIKGMQYRITDFVTTCNITGALSEIVTSSAGHPFDIIVTADNNDTLNANARVCLHEGDAYFANNKLSEWKIKYDINNNTDKYQWADTTGKGVIYWMEDEFGNEASYDFKNILLNGYYTFGSIDKTLDFSLDGECCYENKIKGYYSKNKLILNNILSIYSRRQDMSRNEFGTNCCNIVMNDVCNNNVIGNNCTDITMNNNTYITIAPRCAFLNISSGMRNVCIKNGVSGSSGNVLDISALTSEWTTTVAKSSSGDLKIYNEADLVGGGVVDNSIQHINTILDSVIIGEELDNMDDLLYSISQSSQDLSLINSQLEEIINI